MLIRLVLVSGFMFTISLTDRRTLAYREYGPKSGYPVLYFHGAPSAGLEAELFDLPTIARDLDLRLIAPDRPGLGRSDHQHGRRIAFWPNDVLSLVGLLGIPRFSVLGYSGGGPYALACGRSLPEMIDSITIVSGVCPFDVPGVTDRINPNSLRFLRMSVERPTIARMMTWVMALMARHAPKRVIAQAIASLPQPDARVMAGEAFGNGFARLVAESARRGALGPRLDSALMVQPWGFDPAHITKHVNLWHGEEDRNAPIEMANYLAGRLPSATTHFFPGEGHLSLFARHSREILENLLKAVSPERASYISAETG
jgi:pimeloyl-ACP methyl ester carboxylesterase